MIIMSNVAVDLDNTGTVVDIICHVSIYVYTCIHVYIHVYIYTTKVGQ